MTNKSKATTQLKNAGKLIVQREYSKAIKELDKALKLDKTDRTRLNVIHLKSRALYEQKKYSEAIKELDKIQKLDISVERKAKAKQLVKKVQNQQENHGKRVRKKILKRIKFFKKVKRKKDEELEDWGKYIVEEPEDWTKHLIKKSASRKEISKLIKDIDKLLKKHGRD